MAVSFSVLHTRSGVTALNVVTAALTVDARTASIPVVFATTIPALVESLRGAASKGLRPIAGYSFYSPDFAAAAADLQKVREATGGSGVLHLAGGVHATAEPLATLQAGFELVAVGEGEQTAVDLFAALEAGGDPRGRRWRARSRPRSRRRRWRRCRAWRARGRWSVSGAGSRRSRAGWWRCGRGAVDSRRYLKDAFVNQAGPRRAPAAQRSRR